MKRNHRRSASRPRIGDAANPRVVEEGSTITAVFSSVEPAVSGSGGCNNYFAGYTSTDDGGLTIAVRPARGLRMGYGRRHAAMRPGLPVRVRCAGNIHRQADRGGPGRSAEYGHSIVQTTPVVNVTPPRAAIKGPETAFVGEPVTFDAASSQPGTSAIAGYVWQSGDGDNTGQVS